ncbi:MAG TPA: D-tyrosyl-tRNA(Tyr) deacylase [Deltaproteobacteria bacterium]|nr:D-tyrosyl-tRNA(Tyr) deacylase [Deltaproteobacteria bacterium]
MRLVVQRVSEASVRVEGVEKGSIGRGLAVLAGVEKGDGEKDMEYGAAKVLGLRIFEDSSGRMNLDVRDAAGGLLVVSQFTLLGDVRRGRRPSFERAEEPALAAPLFHTFLHILSRSGVPTVTGRFGARMELSLTNDGPVTILIDTKKLF